MQRQENSQEPGNPAAPEKPDAPPRRRRKDARPAEIIEAGLAEFAEHGFAATKLENVARRAGVAKGTIYRYFADKEALFVAAVRSRMKSVIDDVGGRVPGFDGTTRELLAFVIGNIHARLVESDLRVLVRIIVGEGANFPQLTELYHREVISHGRAMLEAIVKRGISRGEVRPGPAADLPIVLMAPAMMAAVWKATFDRHDPIDSGRFLEAHLDLVLNGLFVQKP